MSEQKQYKIYSINSRSDLIIYLRMLIVQSHKWMKTFDKYSHDLELKVRELNLFENPNQEIDSELYDENNHKLQYAGSKLLNYFGDHANGAMSYYKFRKTLLKRNIEVRKDLADVSEEVMGALRDFNIARNWGLHEPESMLNAHIENIKKLWTQKEVADYLQAFNPIGIPYFVKVEGYWLLSLLEETRNLQEGHKLIFDSMINDYRLLLGDIPEIREQFIPLRPFESEIILPKTSFEMQKGKYKN